VSKDCFGVERSALLASAALVGAATLTSKVRGR